MIFGRFRKRKAEPEIEEVLPPEQEAEQIAKEIKADSAAEKEQVDIKDKSSALTIFSACMRGFRKRKTRMNRLKKSMQR